MNASGFKPWLQRLSAVSKRISTLKKTHTSTMIISHYHNRCAPTLPLLGKEMVSIVLIHINFTMPYNIQTNIEAIYSNRQTILVLLDLQPTYGNAMS